MLAKKMARVWFHTSPAMLLLLKRMLKKPVFPSVLQQLLERKKCNAWVVVSAFLKSCDVADTCWQKNWREFRSVLHLPCCYF